MTRPHPLMAQLQAERQRQNLTVAAIARRVGYTADAMRKWERGTNVPDLDRLDDYATALGLRVQLVPADPNPAPPKEGNR